MVMVSHKTTNNLARHIVSLAWRFIQRWDLYAQQLQDGRYKCVHKPLTIKLLFAHLLGKTTLGAYLLNRDSLARYIVLDSDAEDGFQILQSHAKAFADNGVPSYLESSRRGGHLWIFFPHPLTGREAREFGLGLLTLHQVQEVELFPKQETLTDGPGSLIRLPFGVHQMTRKRYGFFNHLGLPIAGTIREQIEILSDAQVVPGPLIHAYRSNTPVQIRKTGAYSQDDQQNKVWQIKHKIKVLDFVNRYVELKMVGSGAVGLCPFHDDHHFSFSVNDRENYWNCFAGCGGGSVIDFWMKREKCDFSTAVRQLSQML